MNNSPKTVLIVDDEEFIRQSLLDYFEDHLWHPMAARSGEAGLEVLEKTSPLCVIVDIRLDGMDGNSFIRKAVQKKPDMGVVICTGSTEYIIPQDVRALPNVSQRIFHKPVTDLAELEAELLQLLARQNRP